MGYSPRQRKRTITSRSEDDNLYDDDLYVECASCGEQVRRSESFHEGHKDYHSACAGVWQCRVCGTWHETTAKDCYCGEKKP
jgi:hypothetical protein